MGGRCDVAFLHDFVKKNEKKKGVAEVHKAIKEDMEFYGLEVYKQVGLSFASEA